MSSLKNTYKYILLILLSSIGLIVFSNYLKPFWGGSLSPQEIAATTKRSLVLIVTQDNEGRDLSFGSGFFFGNGYVATNLHVFKRAYQGYIKLLADSINYKIDKVVGFDLNHDLCVFTINASKPPASPLILTSSDEIRIGDEIFACGNPKGLEGTFSRGIVSAIHQEAGMIQIDSPISTGSSGGPVVNDRGEVIGIATATIIGGQNLNFAIPVKYLASLPLKYQTPVFAVGALSLIDREVDKIKGPVHKVTEKSAELIFNKRLNEYIEASSRITEEKSYDRKGNELENYNSGIDFPTTNIYEYDQNGILSKTKFLSKYGNHNKTLNEGEGLRKLFDKRKEGMSYNECDKGSTQGAESDRCKYKIYDSNGNLKEWKLDFAVPDKLIYAYDKDGNKIEVKQYATETGKFMWGQQKRGELLYVHRYKYIEFDQMGNWTKRYDYFSEDGENYEPSFVEYREITYY